MFGLMECRFAAPSTLIVTEGFCANTFASLMKHAIEMIARVRCRPMNCPPPKSYESSCFQARKASKVRPVKIVLAYSGGLDTSVILRSLKENYEGQILAFCADIGQEEELAGLEEKALKTGASKCVIEDLQEEFARDFIFPMFQAGAIYKNQYFLGTSIARPLIAKRMVEIARAEKADAIAHGATGKGNDQVRFELTAAGLAPELQVIAAWREERFRKQFPGRAEMIAFTKANKIPVGRSAEKPYSTDGILINIS